MIHQLIHQPRPTHQLIHQLEDNMDGVKIALLIAYAIYMFMAIWAHYKEDIYDEVLYIGIALSHVCVLSNLI